MRMIDTDNETVLDLSPAQMVIARAVIESGEITDCCGDQTIWEDVIDLDGDLCLDEDEFEQVRIAIS